MPIPKNKIELLTAIHDNYAKLKADLITVPVNRTSKKEMQGHAKDSFMSVNNLVAYLIGWGSLVLKWNSRKTKGLEVNFPETGYKWNQLGELAQKFYRDYENNSYKTLLIKLDKTVNEIIQLVQNKSEKELYGTNWHETWTLGRMIQLNTSSPYKNAKDRIRKWKKSTTNTKS